MVISFLEKTLQKFNKYLPIIGLVIFIFILTKIDFNNLYKIKNDIKIYYIILALILLIPFYIIKVWRWHIIMIKQGIVYKFSKSIQLYGIGIFMALITPSRIGELIKINYMKKDGNSIGRSAVSIVLDRLADLIFLIIFGYISMLLFTNFFYNALLTILILFIIASFIIYFLYKTEYYKKIFIWVFDKFFNEKNKKIWHINYRDFINDMKIFKFKEYFYICSITIISWVLYYYIFFILGKAIGIDYIPFWFMSITLTISSFLTLIPISISGIGARDGIFILLLSFYNIPIEKSIILSMLVLLIFVIIALWGLICWFKNPIKAKS